MKTTEQLAADLETLQAGKCWVGYNALEILQDITPEMALYSPFEGGNTIWQLVNHITYWREIVTSRLLYKIQVEDSLNGLVLPAIVDEENWKQAKQRFNRVYKKLVDTIRQFDENQLNNIIEGKGSYYDNITGSLLHDAFHLGQIVLLKHQAIHIEKEEM